MASSSAISSGKKRLASFVIEGPPRFLTGFWMHNSHTIRALLGAIVSGLECAEEVLLMLQPLRLRQWLSRIRVLVLIPERTRSGFDLTHAWRRSRNDASTMGFATTKAIWSSQLGHANPED
jgi:hypothetical protein